MRDVQSMAVGIYYLAITARHHVWLKQFKSILCLAATSLSSTRAALWQLCVSISVSETP